MSSDTNVLMLTALKSGGHNFKIATQPGKWIVAESSLGELSVALDNGDDAKPDLVRSTPDPWAQVRSFAEALLDPVNNDAAVIGQWRALVAILAFAAIREGNYRLTFEPVLLKAGSTRFADVMLKLLPGISLPFRPDKDGQSQGWDNTVVVRLKLLETPADDGDDGPVLALLNPACLIAPGRNADKWVGNSGWMKHGLIDPLTAKGPDSLSPSELQALAFYLRRLDAQIGALCTEGGSRTLNRLQQRITEFETAVRQQPGYADVDAEQAAFEPGDEPNTRLPAPYRLITTPVREKASGPGKSQCIIPLRQDLADPPFAGLVLLDKELASDTRPATGIPFWSNKTLQQVLDMRPAERKALAEDIGKAGYMLVTPDDFFTQVMVRLNDEDRPGEIDAHDGLLRDHLLPLSPLVLLVLSPAEIAQRIAFTRQGRVSLDIKVDARTHVLSRTYPEGKDSSAGALIPKVDWNPGEFALWPNFVSPQWHHYAARLQYNRQNLKQLRGRFAVSGGIIAQQLRHAQQHTHRAELAALWSSSQPLDPRTFPGQLDRIPTFGGRHLMEPSYRRLRARDTDLIVSEVQVSSLPFEAAFFTLAVSKDEPQLPVGMALLQFERLAGTDDSSGDVAIDFGTTNTIACLNRAEPARLQARVVHPVQLGAGRRMAAGQLGQDLREFLPPDDRLLPTPTVVISREVDSTISALLDRKENTEIKRLATSLLIRQLMYFQPDFESDGTMASISLKDWTTLLGRLKFDLKWNTEPGVRANAGRYIRQLVLMLAAEWAAQNRQPRQLRWHFSRPDSMGKANNAELEGIIRDGIRDVLAQDATEGDSAPNGPFFVSEGKAAAAYVLREDPERGITKSAINVILDIGGGTTDIAAYNSNAKPTPIFKKESRSIRIAGGDFFTAFITNNPSILRELGLSSWADIFEQLRQGGDNNITSKLQFVGELLFSGKTLENALNEEWNLISGTPLVQQLKETCLIYLGGIAWHVGWELGQYVRAGDIALTDLQDVSVALCGRGSGFFARLHGKNPRAQSIVSDILQLIPVAAGLDEPEHVQVILSDHPKIEVAAGTILLAGGGQERGPGKAAQGSTPPKKNFGSARDSRAGVLASAGGAFGEREPDELTVPPPQIGREALGPFLGAFEIATGCAVQLTDYQMKILINGAHALRQKDLDAGRDEQSEFAYILKMLVEMMRSPQGNDVRPRTIWG
jgi:hypothetical protein